MDAQQRGHQAVRTGIRIGAQGTGGYLSTVVGPEAGAAAGQMLSEAGELAVGWWEQRSQGRIARTLANVSEQVAERRAAGEVTREELADQSNDEAVALFEAVVEAAARSTEECKCKVVANLYASIAFDPSVSVSDALLYLRRIRDSSWRQLVALRYFETEDRRTERERIGAARSERDLRMDVALGAELAEAVRTLDLIGLVQPDPTINPSEVWDGVVSSSITGKLSPTGVGARISRLGRLAEIVTTEELDFIAFNLRSEKWQSWA